MAGRTFAHRVVVFRRTVTQQQAVTVAVDPGLDDATQDTVARQLAPSRLKARWDDIDIGDAEIVSVEDEA